MRKTRGGWGERPFPKSHPSYFRSARFNLLSPNSDEHKISPNITHTFSGDKVMRINKMITKEKMP